ncbi:MAG: tetratricopeptide repeat protein [Burkholderiales bacterium]|nr:tetratricopeptide repeat protein [Burkholderiales bacterium]
MAAYDLEEQERIDALKDWWAKWGMWIYAAVGAFLIGVLAVQGWRYYQKSEGEQAEVLFKSVQKTAQESAAAKETKKLSEAASAIAEKFPNTFYASEAQLMAAKASFDANDLVTAKKHLQWVVDKGPVVHSNVAKVRLASVLLEESKFDDALKILDQVKDEAFVSMAADLRGDVLVSQGRRDEARAAYQIAVEKAGDRSPMKALSQAKLDSVGGSTAKPADKKDDSKDKKDSKEAAK